MSIEIEGIKFYTVAELVILLNVSAQTIRRYIHSGKLRGQRVGRPMLITEKSLHEFLGVGDTIREGSK